MIALGLTATTSATDEAIHKKMFVSSATVLLISNEEMNDTMQLVKSLEESGLLISSVIQIIKNESKEQKSGFAGMLLVTLGASLLGNLLTGKIRASEGVRAGQDF